MKNKRYLTVLLVALVVLGMGIWAGLPHIAKPTTPDGDGSHPKPPPEPTPASASLSHDTLRYLDGAPQLTMIQAQTIQATPVPLTDSLSARIVYDDNVTARIGVNISGRIVSLKADPGDAVKVGQVLAEIDSPDFGTASADLNKAQADEKLKHQALERAQALGPGEAISVKEWEAAQSDYAQAQAEATRAAQRIKNLNPHAMVVKGQRVSLTSPINGVVTERTATPALEVNPSLPAPLFVVTDPRHLWLMIDMPERLLGHIKQGSSVDVESDAYPDGHFTAKIVQIGQVIDPNTRRIAVRASLDNTALKLLPEMFVRAHVLQENGTGVKVPNSAIVNQGVYAYVFVQTSPGAFHRQAVSLLTRGSDSSYVGTGLHGGESIVTSGALLLDAEMTAQAAGDKK